MLPRKEKGAASSCCCCFFFHPLLARSFSLSLSPSRCRLRKKGLRSAGLAHPRSASEFMFRPFPRAFCFALFGSALYKDCFDDPDMLRKDILCTPRGY